MGGILRRFLGRRVALHFELALLELEPGPHEHAADDRDLVGIHDCVLYEMRRFSISRAVRAAGSVAMRSSAAIRSSSRPIWPLSPSFSPASNSIRRCAARSPPASPRLLARSLMML